MDTVHECDRRTDRRTDGQTDRITITKTVQTASHGKNGKISNGHISARGRPIHFMFGSAVGFSFLEDGGSNGAISGLTKSKILENSNGDISAMDHPFE